MQAVKRIEIIVDALEAREVCAVLQSCGVSGYSVIRDVLGVGHRGEQRGDDLTDVFKNSYVLTTCAPEELGGIVAALRPILSRRGGVCLVSDAAWVVH